jgi:aspartate kinase
MKIFKFGGASVQTADAVKNVAFILQNYGSNPLVVVISAMGKTTNALENVINAYWQDKDYRIHIQEIRKYHHTIMEGLFSYNSGGIWDEIENYFIALELYFEKELERNYDYIYDQIIGYGEIISTRIVSAYLNDTGYRNKWLDARNFIITDNLHREARVDWTATVNIITKMLPTMLAQSPVITQGFIGSTKDNVTTTLGREGSDFTASIFAHALHAEELVIWKDVPGVLNADPRKFPNTVKFDELSYEEAIEMTYYGATVLHPKTIKPIQNRNIPLNVRSFIHPEKAGTIIRADFPIREDVPIIILKEKQILVSLSSRDFSFIAEHNIEDIFDLVVKFGISVNVMTNSAISFRMCIDDMGQKVESFIKALEEEFEVAKQEGMSLLTIKHYREELAAELLGNKKVVLEMKSGSTVQYVIA